MKYRLGERQELFLDKIHFGRDWEVDTSGLDVLGNVHRRTGEDSLGYEGLQ